MVGQSRQPVWAPVGAPPYQPNPPPDPWWPSDTDTARSPDASPRHLVGLASWLSAVALSHIAGVGVGLNGLPRVMIEIWLTAVVIVPPLGAALAVVRGVATTAAVGMLITATWGVVLFGYGVDEAAIKGHSKVLLLEHLERQVQSP
jgi:hypothetical protein